MFTGIITAKGTVVSLTPNSFGVRLLINPNPTGDQLPEAWPAFPSEGDSVAINGCCLTYAPHDGDPSNHLGFDVIKETLDKTSLGRLATGSPVNLELSLTASTPMGGHFVQGHVDSLGRIADIKSTAEECVVTVAAPDELMPFIVPKGSITIDGISLTIARVDTAKKQFAVALIPTTLKLTTLGEANVGDTVNLETDIIARTVVHWLEAKFGGAGGSQPNVTMQTLKDAGFVG